MTRPGMSDGRAFGSKIFEPNIINEHFQGKEMSNEEYKGFLIKNAEEVKTQINKKFLQPKPFGI